ncbi:ethanolamine kinase 2 isoform X2 [Hemicordylus capensis]|uniref:ethanolamine kinase 2 isoform X2 n=1 Tax=Hemicordylus capensis TaxID=884348 RepID=UPI0023025916|nr:ethanolamine kinase 2 isoform X2 [Hemicordylus capensis]
MGYLSRLPLLRGWSCWPGLFLPAFLPPGSVLHLVRAELCPDCIWGMEEEEEEKQQQQQRISTSYPAIQRVSIAVDETNVLPGALQLIRKLRPQWETERVKTKLFTDGITNKLMACFTDENMRDAVLVRVYGRKTELIVDRANELRNFQVLQDHGCAPNLYFTFENGYCYEFMQGKALGPEHVRQPQIFSLCPEVHIPSLEVLEEEICWMKEHLSHLGSPTVFCHNDLLSKNIIYNEAEGHVRFIDYEYTGYNYQAFDIGNHFNEFAGLNEVDYNLYPCRETQLQWLSYYLQAYKKLSQQDQCGGSKSRGESGHVSEEELETLYVQVNQFALASHFLWACWGLIQAQFSTIDFNFARYADIRFKQYFKAKPVVTALKTSK